MYSQPKQPATQQQYGAASGFPTPSQARPAYNYPNQPQPGPYVPATAQYPPPTQCQQQMPPPGYGQSAEYGQPAGYVQPAEYGRPAGYGQPAGFGQSAEYGQPSGYDPAGGYGQQPIPVTSGGHQYQQPANYAPTPAGYPGSLPPGGSQGNQTYPGGQQQMDGSSGNRLGQLAGMVPPQILNKLPGGLGAVLGGAGHSTPGQYNNHQYEGKPSASNSAAQKIAAHALKAYMKK